MALCERFNTLSYYIIPERHAQFFFVGYIYTRSNLDMILKANVFFFLVWIYIFRYYSLIKVARIK